MIMTRIDKPHMPSLGTRHNLGRPISVALCTLTSHQPLSGSQTEETLQVGEIAPVTGLVLAPALADGTNSLLLGTQYRCTNFGSFPDPVGHSRLINSFHYYWKSYVGQFQICDVTSLGCLKYNRLPNGLICSR